MERGRGAGGLRARGALRRGGAVAVAALTAIAAATAPVRAQPARAANLPIIRDAEIEQLLRDYLAPIVKVAGLAQQNVRVVIINQRTFNAFVMDGRRIFVNAGALLDSQTPNQIIGVLAHEVGHIAGGHLARMRQELANVQTTTLIGMLLGAGAIAAGAASGSRGDGLARAGVAALSAQPEIARRSLLAYQRSHEESADRAAIRFLTATGQSPKGMYDTFKRFAEQTLFISQGVDPYTQSHPMPRERLEALAAIAHASPYWNKADPPQLQLRHDLMRAKLSGFLDRPDAIARRYPLSDNSLPARYARAISAYRHADLRTALAQIDALIQSDPANPYFHELKGQVLLESGRASEAIGPLRRAVSLAPNAMLVRILLGQALVASNDRGVLDEAIAMLRTALAREPEVPDGFRQLAIAFARKGDRAQADLASAQAAFAAGEIKTARELAGRARHQFPIGSPGWVKADDIYSYKPPVSDTGGRPN
ncbi:MAG: M48 family metallopeptidase [Variibacter sp.]|nr:M48 family metallopeptidase [Variibacter sp.]